MNALLSATPRHRFSDFFELTKPRITLLVLVTAAVGYLCASPTSFEWTGLIHLLIGTALASSGASTLNQVVEREPDAKMRRTMRRPIPSGRIRPFEGGIFGVTLAALGCLYLWFFVNGWTAALAFATIASYLFLYTPLKRVTSLSTVVGAIPGALPPMGGWAAAQGRLDAGAWVLFAILFLWQLPHFLAIAWMFRDDYARAGFPMLPVVDPDGGMTGRQIVVYTAFLVPISLSPWLFGFAGFVYFVGAFLLGAGFFFVGVRVALIRSIGEARRLLLASVVYLPVLLGLLVLDRFPGGF